MARGWNRWKLLCGQKADMTADIIDKFEPSAVRVAAHRSVSSWRSWLSGGLVLTGFCCVPARALADGEASPRPQAGEQAMNARPASPTATTSTADLEILATRALYQLRQGQFAQARDTTAAFVQQDASRRLQYFHGVACARLDLLPCAEQDLRAVANSSQANTFPQLPLELGVVLYRLGMLADARTYLTQAIQVEALRSEAEWYLERVRGAEAEVGLLTRIRRRWGLFAASGGGFDSNVPQVPNVDDGALALILGSRYDADGSTGDGSFDGPVLSERAGGWYQHSLTPALQLGVSYQFLLRSYPDPALSPFTLQDHRLEVGFALPRGFELAYTLQASVLNTRFDLPYTLNQQATLRYRALARPNLNTWLEYRFSDNHFGDLAEIWAPSDSEVTCSDTSTNSSLGGYCTRQRSGFAQWAEAGGQWKAAWARVIGAVGGGWRFASANIAYDGYELLAQVRGEIELPYKLMLSPGINIGVQSYQGDAAIEGWTAQHLQPSLGLRVPLTAQLRLEAQYTLSLGQSQAPETDPNVYERHFALLEAAYVY